MLTRKGSWKAFLSSSVNSGYFKSSLCFVNTICLSGYTSIQTNWKQFLHDIPKNMWNTLCFIAKWRVYVEQFLIHTEASPIMRPILYVGPKFLLLEQLPVTPSATRYVASSTSSFFSMNWKFKWYDVVSDYITSVATHAMLNLRRLVWWYIPNTRNLLLVTW